MSLLNRKKHYNHYH